MGEERSPEHVEIAHRVENLVLDEFIVRTQALFIEDVEFVHHDRVVERPALGEAHAAQHLHILHEAERAGAADGVLIAFAGEVDFGRLRGGVDRRMPEIDLEGKLEARMRLEPSELVAVAHLDGALHAHETARRLLLDHLGALDEKDEARAGSIHDRDLGRIHLDDAVVDAESAEGAHQVLDRRDGGPSHVDGRGHARVVHIERMRRYVHGRLKIHAAENDAGVGVGRPQHEPHLAAAVKTDADGGDRFAERALLEHLCGYLFSQVGGRGGAPWLLPKPPLLGRTFSARPRPADRKER